MKRLDNVIFNQKYKLNEFGQANAQEILGWVGSNDFPVINGRTTKILRYFECKATVTLIAIKRYRN